MLLVGHWRFIVLCGVLALLASWPLAAAYIQTAQQVGVRSYWGTLSSMRELVDWVHASQGSIFYNWLLSDSGLVSENGRNPGLVVSLLAIFTVFSCRRRLGLWIIFLSWLSLLVVTVRVGEFSFWRIIYELVPGAQAIRGPGRATSLLMVGVGIAAGFAVSRWRMKCTNVVFVLPLVACLLLEQWSTSPTFDANEVRIRVDRIQAGLSPETEIFLLVGEGKYLQDDAMALQLRSGIPTINGRYGNFPQGEHALTQAIQQHVWRHWSPRPLNTRAVSSSQWSQALDDWVAVHGLEARRIEILTVDNPDQ